MFETRLATKTRVDGRYEILEFIGGGGMGSVYKAREIELDRIVALKILHADHASSKEDLARFEREGQILSELSHRNIALFYKVAYWNEAPYIAMEFMQGQSLRQKIDAAGKMEWRRALSIVNQAASGLDHAHEHGVVHRDIKPDNILLVTDPTPDSRVRDDRSEREQRSIELVKIVDFGLARAQLAGEITEQKLTQTGMLIGSVQYMSPEQCTGQRADRRSDIYSLGCVLYECLTGRPPFDADNPIGLLHMHVNSVPASMGQNLPAGLEAVVFKAMAKNASERYQSMLEFSKDLDLVLCGKGKEVQAGDLPARPRRKASPFVPAILAILAACLITPAVIFFNDSLLVSTSVGLLRQQAEPTTRARKTVDWALWLAVHGRPAVADQLLTDLAPAGKYKPIGVGSYSPSLVTALADRKARAESVESETQSARAYLLRAQLAYARGNPREAMSFCTSAMQTTYVLGMDSGVYVAHPDLWHDLLRLQISIFKNLPGRTISKEETVLRDAAYRATTVLPNEFLPECNELVPLLTARCRGTVSESRLWGVLAALHLRDGDVSNAVRLGTVAIECTPQTKTDTWNRTVLYAAYIEQGKWKDAGIALAGAVANSALTYLTTADLLVKTDLAQHDFTAAEKRIRDALAQTSFVCGNRLDLVRDLVDINLIKGNKAAAQSLVLITTADAKTLQDHNPIDCEYQYLNQLGWHSDMKNWQKVLELCKTLPAGLPRQEASGWLVGQRTLAEARALSELGRHEEAARVLEQLGDTYVRGAAELKILLLLNSGDFDGARKLIDHRYSESTLAGYKKKSIAWWKRENGRRESLLMTLNLKQGKMSEALEHARNVPMEVMNLTEPRALYLFDSIFPEVYDFGWTDAMRLLYEHGEL